MDSSNSNTMENGASPGRTGILIDFSDEQVIPMPPAFKTFAELDDTYGIFHLPISRTQSNTNIESHCDGKTGKLVDLSFNQTRELEETPGKKEFNETLGYGIFHLPIPRTQSNIESHSDGKTGKLVDLSFNQTRELEETPGKKEFNETLGKKQLKETPGKKELTETLGERELEETPRMKEFEETPRKKELDETPGKKYLEETPGFSVDSEFLDIENLSFFNATNISDADFSIEIPKDTFSPCDSNQTKNADNITSFTKPTTEPENHTDVTVVPAEECEKDSGDPVPDEKMEVKSKSRQVSHWPHVHRTPVATLESIRRKVEEIFHYVSPSEADIVSAEPKALPVSVVDYSHISPVQSPSTATAAVKERTPMMKVKPIPFQLLPSPIKEDPLPKACSESTSRSRIYKTPKKPTEVPRTPQSSCRSRTPVRLEFNNDSQGSTEPELKICKSVPDKVIPTEEANTAQLLKNSRKLQLPTFKFGGFHKNKLTAPKAIVQPMKAMISSDISKAAAAAAISPPNTPRNEIVPSRGKFIPPIASSSPIAKTTATPSESWTPSKSRRNSTVKSSGYGRQSVNLNTSGSGSALNTSRNPPPSPVRSRRSFSHPPSPVKSRQSFSHPPSPIGPRQSITCPSPIRARHSISQAPSPTVSRPSKIQPPCPIVPRQSNIPPPKSLDKFRTFTRGELDASKLKKVFSGTGSLRLPSSSSKENRPTLSQVFTTKK